MRVRPRPNVLCVGASDHRRPPCRLLELRRHDASTCSRPACRSSRRPRLGLELVLPRRRHVDGDARTSPADAALCSGRDPALTAAAAQGGDPGHGRRKPALDGSRSPGAARTREAARRNCRRPTATRRRRAADACPTVAELGSPTAAPTATATGRRRASTTAPRRSTRLRRTPTTTGSATPATRRRAGPTPTATASRLLDDRARPVGTLPTAARPRRTAATGDGDGRGDAADAMPARARVDGQRLPAARGHRAVGEGQAARLGRASPVRPAARRPCTISVAAQARPRAGSRHPQDDGHDRQPVATVKRAASRAAATAPSS